MKKKAISIICLFLTVTMLTGMFPVSVSAADSGVITGTFTYMPSFVDAAATDTFYYSDGWFSSPAAQQNDHLRTMSMVLALASMEIEGSTYITKLYNDLGYTDIRIDEMNEKPTANTIGTAIAHKRIDGRDVVALSIRGNKYGAEWASNLLAGAEGNIEGFDSAAGKVIDRLKSYIAEHQLSSAKLWIAGYSRAGSVADLLGVYINEHLDEFSTAADDVYVYCFEAPRCCASDKVYPNIYCIRNKNDLITYVYPESWGLYTNGVDIVIGSDLTVDVVKIDVFSTPMTVKVGKASMEECCAAVIDFIAEELTREKFSGDFDDSVAALIELFFSKPTSEWMPLVRYFVEGDFIQRVKDNDRAMHVLMFEGTGGVMIHNSDKMYRQFTDELLLVLDELVKAEDLGLSAEEYQTVRDALYPLLRGIGPVIIKDYFFRADDTYALYPDYNDPDYDPQTDEDVLMTYDQYEEYQANRPEEPKEPKSDAEQAWTDAYESDAYQRGLDDCFAGRERITEPSQPENAGERSQEYLETFARTYLECYNTGYDDGISELNPKSDVYYAGMSDAENAALQHAVKDAETESYKASFNETPTPREDGAPYLQDYLNGYAENYAEYYENFYYNTVENNMKMTLAHLGTLAANAESILTQHYPQTNWALIKALDPYYRVVGDADGDGDVTIMDATRIQRWLAELSDMDGSAFSGAKLTDTERMAADADGDGEVTIMDATRIQRWLAELDRSEYIGKAIA